MATTTREFVSPKVQLMLGFLADKPSIWMGPVKALNSRKSAVAGSAAVLLLLCAAQVAVADGGRKQRDDMLAMLSAVPAIEEVRRLLPVVTYLDIDALERIYAIDEPLGNGSDPQRVAARLNRWAATVSRFVCMPVDPPIFVPQEAATSLMAHAAEADSGLPTFFALGRAFVLGCEWSPSPGRSALDSILVGYAGKPQLTDPALLDSALTGRGFVRRQDVGLPVWERPDIGGAAAQSPRTILSEEHDYFGRLLKHVNELALSEGLILLSPVRGMAESFTAINWDKVPSLAQIPDVRAAVEALIDPTHFDAALVQAWLYDKVLTLEAAALGSVGPYASSEQQQQQAEQLRSGFATALPPYRWFAVADMQADHEELIAIALTYENLSDAERAAKTVAQRLPFFTPLKYEVPLTSLFDFGIASHAYISEDLDVAVAVVTLRHPYPVTEKIDIASHGKFARTIFEALETYSFTPLIVVAPDSDL